VTVADTLTMELTVANDSCGEPLEIENCLHTYFHVGDIGQVSLAGCKARRLMTSPPAPTARAGWRTIRCCALRRRPTAFIPTRRRGGNPRRKVRRVIRVEKSNSQSTVVWNPWTTQKLPDDFDPAEHQNMVCVESGNVKQNKISLAPGKATSLKVILSSQPLK
jgi:glucose-6-phosphate 1-epimerase